MIRTKLLIRAWSMVNAKVPGIKFQGLRVSTLRSIVISLGVMESVLFVSGHSQLVGSNWGTARNLTSLPGVQQMSLGDVSACEDAKQASKYRFTLKK